MLGWDELVLGEGVWFEKDTVFVEDVRFGESVFLWEGVCFEEGVVGYPNEPVFTDLLGS